MADATHDFADDGFHEIHLSGKQLVALFMGLAAVCVLIFLCGVVVGRSVPVQRAQEPFGDTTLASNNVPTPSPSPAPAPTHESTPLPPAEPPDPSEDAPPPASSLKERLESPTPARDSLEPVSAPAPGATSSAPAAKPAPKPEPPARKPQAAAAQTSGAPQPGTYVLQVHALRDEKVANSIVERLSKKGYPAYVVASGAPTNMYRVFVGRFKERREAERVAERLKKEEQFNPWLTTSR